MNTTTRASRHSLRLAQQSIAYAGTRTDVARALGRDRSTVSHECTTRSHPVLAAAFDLFLGLVDSPGVSGRAFAEAAAEAVELREVVAEETAKLVERGLFLLDDLGRRLAGVYRQSLLGPLPHAESLRPLASVASELAAYLDELSLREVDLHQTVRIRRVS